MKWIITFLIFIIAAAGGYYYYTNQHQAEGDPLDFCQENSWLIFKFQDGQMLSDGLSDSNSIFGAIPEFEPIIQNVNAVLKNAVGPGYVVVSGTLSTPQITVILLNGKPTSIEGWRLIDGVSSPMSVFTNFDSYTPLTEANKGQFSSIRNQTAPNRMMFNSKGANEILGNSINGPFKELLLAQFPKEKWVSFDLNIGTRLLGTAVSKTNAREPSTNSVDLFRYLPSKTTSAVLFSAPFSNIAIAYCNYSLNDSANIFMLIEDKSDSTSSLSQIASNYFDHNWISNSIIASIGTIQLLSKDKEASSRFINDYKAYNRLSETAAFGQVSDQSSDAGFSLYIQKPSLNAHRLILGDIDEDNAISTVLFQTNAEFGDTKSYALSIAHHSETKEELRKIWSFVLDKAAEAGPWKFINHYTDEDEFIFQDKLHQLYLINADGKILWKKQLDNTIVGEIQMVDAFDSGKQQMLFVTQKRLFLLDRNGNNVDGFPVRLSAEPLCGPAGIRYERGGDLRILVSEGRKVQNYTAEGQNTEGWNSPKVGRLVTPIQLLQIGNKDYLVALTMGDTLMFLDRSGKERKKAISLDMRTKQRFLVTNGDLNSSYVIAIDEIGNVIKMDFNGKQSPVSLPTDSNSTITINNSNDAKYSVIGKDFYSSFDSDFNSVFEYLFPSNIQASTKWLSEREELIALSTGDDLYVMHAENGPLDRMPVSGDLRCLLIDVDQNEILELVSHDKDGTISCYQLSY